MPRTTIRRPKPHRRAPDIIDTHKATSSAPPQIAALRVARGLSQADLALRTGVSQTTISYIESGSRRISLNLLFFILDALRADFRYENNSLKLIPKAPTNRITT